MSKIKACLLLILDGLGDRPFRELDGKTPLEAAHTPHLDRLSELGATGLYHAERPGIALPSEEAHLLLFGFDRSHFPGRGYLEALGADIELDREDVAILAHFVSVEQSGDGLILKKDRPKASIEEVQALCNCLTEMEDNGLTVSFIPTKGLDGVILIRGEASPNITDTDPLCEGMPIIEPEPLGCSAQDENAKATARALKTYQLSAYHILRGHEVNTSRLERGLPPLNFLATNRAGAWKAAPSFFEKWGLKGATISTGMVYKGISRHLGLTHIRPSDASSPAQEISERVSMAIEATDTYQFIHVHTKVPDEAAHTKVPQKKVEAIEELDRGLGLVVERLVKRRDLILIITSDHSTPSGGPLIHSGEPVPLMAIGATVRRDFVRKFSEISCAQGALGHLYGEDLMWLILNWMDRVKLKGLMDTPIDQHYWPGRRNRFRLD